MSKSVAKNVKDKKGVSAASTPVVTHEIIQEKLTDQEWLQMLIKDEDENFISDIIEDVIGNAMSNIYDLYLDYQLLPYTLSQVKDALIHIVEWRFLLNDLGEDDTIHDPAWQLGDEPSPCVIDCWAQGSVPVLWNESPIPEVLVEEATITERTDTEAVLESVSEIHEQISEDFYRNIPTLVDMTTSVCLDSDITLQNVRASQQASQQTTQPATQAAKPKKTRHYGKLKSAGVSRMTETLEDTEQKLLEEEYNAMLPRDDEFNPDLINMPAACHTLIKLQQQRRRTGMVLDEYGNVLTVMKINPEKLPSHRVKIQYKIPSSKVTDDGKKKAYTLQPVLKKSKPKTSPHKDIVTFRDGRTTVTETPRISEIITPTRLNGLGCQTTITNLPCPLVENIELSPGVTVREGDKVRKGPYRKHRKMAQLSSTSSLLRAISAPDNVFQVLSADVVAERTPSVKVLPDIPPIPPIAYSPSPLQKMS